MADDLATTLDLLGVDYPVLAGYSMGAWIAAVFANRQPGRALRIVMVDGGLPLPVDETRDPDEILDAMIGPSLQRLRATFPTREAYFDFYRTHPAFIGWWHPELETVLDYEIREVEDGFAVDANQDAVATSGRDITLTGSVTGAARNLTVPTEVLIVDHGMVGRPGGFIPLEVAKAVCALNPAVTYTMHQGLNHYSLMMGPGAPRVAEVIAHA
jgi:pimeloyl-ACP methyl ester carboxylesterase